MPFFKRKWVPRGRMQHRWSIRHRIKKGGHVFERVDADTPPSEGEEVVDVFPFLDEAGYYLIRLEYPMGELSGFLLSRAFAKFLRTTFRHEVEQEVGFREVSIYLGWRGEMYYIRDGKGRYESLSRLIPP